MVVTFDDSTPADDGNVDNDNSSRPQTHDVADQEDFALNAPISEEEEEEEKKWGKEVRLNEDGMKAGRRVGVKQQHMKGWSKTAASLRSEARTRTTYCLSSEKKSSIPLAHYTYPRN